MTTTPEPTTPEPTTPERSTPDRTPPEPATDTEAAEALIDQEAAEIDARDPDVAERIAEIAEDAEDLGLVEPDAVDAPTSSGEPT